MFLMPTVSCCSRGTTWRDRAPTRPEPPSVSSGRWAGDGARLGGNMSLVEEVGAGLDGLAQLRALICSGRKPGILRALDFEVVEVEFGHAVFTGTQ
jgi:hypothetical protein